MREAPDVAAGRGEGELHLQCARRRPAQRQVDRRALARHVGGDPDGPQVVGRAALQEHALPDAADRPVPALLAVRDLGEGVAEVGVRVGTGIHHPHDELVVLVETQRGVDRDLERQIAALVLPEQDAVEPHRGEVVHRAEAEEVDGLFTDQPLRLLPVEGAAVPGQAGIVAQVGKLGLPGSRHLNRPQLGAGQRRRVE